MDVVYLDLIKGCFLQISPEQLGKIQTGRVLCETGRKLANRLHSEGGDQCFLFRLEAVKSWIPREMILGPTLFNIFPNYLGDGVEITLTISADNTTEGGEVDTSEGRAASQRDLDRLEEWSRKNKMKFNKGV